MRDVDHAQSAAIPLIDAAIRWAFLAGCVRLHSSVFTLVLVGTYVGIGALAHDYGFSLAWVLVSTTLMWAGPSQVILISALGTGATLFETGMAVTLSAVRFLPMVVALLAARARAGDAASRSACCRRISPPPACGWNASGCCRRCRGSGASRSATALASASCCRGMSAASSASILAASLPALLTAALLFLTPMSFLVSTARNSATLVNRLALGLGLVICPLLTYFAVGLDLMWTGIIAGTAAYGIHRLRGALR